MGQLDFVMDCPQADVSTGHVYIAISKGFDLHCLQVLKSIYSVQDAGITGDQYLVKGLSVNAHVRYVCYRKDERVDQISPVGVRTNRCPPLGFQQSISSKSLCQRNAKSPRP
jgi:hypothetical protein